MRSSRRQSLIVNNFFTLASIVMLSITMVLYSKFIANDEPEEAKKIKVIPLSCEKDIFSTSKVYNQKLLNDSLKALDKGYYKLDGAYVKSVHSDSIIEEFVSLGELDGFYKKAIEKNPKEDISKFLTIKYEIIENDKKDPNKKSKECKICSGSILTSFKANEAEIFRFYIDFNLYDKDEISRRIDCTIKAYRNNAKKIL